MSERTQCQTLTNGVKVWAAAKDKAGNKIVRNGKVVRYPVIVGPKDEDGEYTNAIRCETPAVTSRMRNGQTEHKCAAHIGVWYVDVDGEKRDYDDNVIPRT